MMETNASVIDRLTPPHICPQFETVRRLDSFWHLKEIYVNISSSRSQSLSPIKYKYVKVCLFCAAVERTRYNRLKHAFILCFFLYAWNTGTILVIGRYQRIYIYIVMLVSPIFTYTDKKIYIFRPEFALIACKIYIHSDYTVLI